MEKPGTQLIMANNACPLFYEVKLRSSFCLISSPQNLYSKKMWCTFIPAYRYQIQYPSQLNRIQSSKSNNQVFIRFIL